MTSKWQKMKEYVLACESTDPDYFTELSRFFDAIQKSDEPSAMSLLHDLVQHTTSRLDASSTISIHSARDTILKLTSISEVRSVIAANAQDRHERLSILNKRLNVIGSYDHDKQFILGIRRAAMGLNPVFTRIDVATTWLTTAKLARKSSRNTQAFNATLHAAALGDRTALIEQAKLLWREGDQRKAIQTIEGAIDSDAFVTPDVMQEDGNGSIVPIHTDQNVMKAKALIMLGKWLGMAGQTSSDMIIETLRKGTAAYRKYEKGWYLLGKHYNKILDSEKARTPEEQNETFLKGEQYKLVIDNYLRSLSVGSKYVFQTLPKLLTLWLELVDASETQQDTRRGNTEFRAHLSQQRKKIVEDVNAQMKKYVERIQVSLFYNILPQLVARIAHKNTTVYDILTTMILRIIKHFPQQALWTVLPIIESVSKDRQARGLSIIKTAVDAARKAGKNTTTAELRSMISGGQVLVRALLEACNHEIAKTVSRVSLQVDLNFRHSKVTPSHLVVPVGKNLIATLPTSHEPAAMKSFRAFSNHPVTITGFLDEAVVLSSLQRPRKLTVLGSDGLKYSVLAKPKDDMRKDQRLTEFNNMVNRFLKRDAASSRRRLFIRTYAVVPLNEECGLIEWVDNLKTLREILLKLYRERSIIPNYSELRSILDQACAGERGCGNEKKFTEKILPMFPPVFGDWFVETFPDPSAWFTARLLYTRSLAVMSIVGHILGLGDRHGENILFDENSGLAMHVDFNCLFDKGLTFEKPELVPFRLTHNLVAAMGIYKIDGPFRRCCEITYELLRNNEDALLTILETFVHDPTVDMMQDGSRGGNRANRRRQYNVPETPQQVLASVKGKIKGFIEGESVPLGVGGYAQVMIKRATDPVNLCRMYIGWCAFF